MASARVFAQLSGLHAGLKSQSCARSLVSRYHLSANCGTGVPEPWKDYTVNRGASLAAGLVEGLAKVSLQYRRLSQFGVIVIQMAG
jgi:hypothetical protein